jgi:hypothetical protein
VNVVLVVACLRRASTRAHESGFIIIIAVRTVLACLRRACTRVPVLLHMDLFYYYRAVICFIIVVIHNNSSM